MYEARSLAQIWLVFVKLNLEIPEMVESAWD